MKVGHSRHSALMSSVSGARNSSTMIVTMIAMTPSEKASTRVTPAVPSWVGPSSSPMSVMRVLLTATEARDTPIFAKLGIQARGDEVHGHGVARGNVATRTVTRRAGDRGFHVAAGRDV